MFIRLAELSIFYVAFLRGLIFFLKNTEMKIHVDEDGCLVMNLGGEELVTADEPGFEDSKEEAYDCYIDDDDGEFAHVIHSGHVEAW